MMESLTAHCLASRHRWLAILFAGYALSGCIACAILMPPYLNPDEPAHFLRADAISIGGLVGKRETPRRAGGTAHGRIAQAAEAIWSSQTSVDSRIDERTLAASNAFRWGSAILPMDFPNTALYPPTSYIPSVVGILLGRAVDLSVTATLVLARCVNALVYVAIGTIAIFEAGLTAPLVFSVLLIPTSIVAASAITQDGMLIGLSALAISLAMPGLGSQTGMGRCRTALTAVALTIVIVARPPYLPFAFMPLLVRGTSLQFRVACTATIITACVLWTAITAMLALVPLPAVDPLGPPDTARQIQFLVHNPGMIGSIMVATVSSFAYPFYFQFIGLGAWYLPINYYHLAWCIVLLSALISMFGGERRGWGMHAAWISGLILSAALLIVVICYIGFTSVGALVAAGLGGRYFVPLALFIPGILPVLPIGGKPVQALALSAIAIFPAISIATLLYAVVWRFYLGV